MIFAHCDEIIKLTMVCPKFNNIISNSHLLMSRLQVRLRKTKKSIRKLLQSDRKYKRLSIDNNDPENAEQVNLFVEKHQRTLRELTINYSKHSELKMEPQQLHGMLSTLSERLNTLTTSTPPNEFASMDALEFPNLETWTCRTICVNKFQLHNWKTPKLKKLIYENVQLASSNHRVYSENIISFLRSQTQLKDLWLDSTHDTQAFLKAAKRSPFAFNLTRIRIECSSNYNDEVVPFVESQRNSLKILSLRRFTIKDEDFQRILALQLEEFELSYADFSSLRPSSIRSQTIKKLSFKAFFPHMCYPLRDGGLTHVIASCPEVDTVFIKRYDMTREMSAAFASMPKLKNLTLSGISFQYDFDDFYPKLESFTTNQVRREIWRSIVAVNRHVRFIKVENDDDNNSF